MMANVSVRPTCSLATIAMLAVGHGTRKRFNGVDWHPEKG